MLTLRAPRIHFISSYLLLACLLLPNPKVHAAPLCSGLTSVASLGAQGCTFENLTFSGFELVGTRVPAGGNPVVPIPFDPADILVNVVNTTLPINFAQSIPAIGLVVTPRNLEDWVAGPGFPSGFNFALHYVVSATGATFDKYQIRGNGSRPVLRGGAWRALLNVTNGSGELQTGPFGPFGEIGMVANNVAQIQVTSSGGAVAGFTGGSAFLRAMTSVFTLGPAPVPGPGTLALSLLALITLRIQGRRYL